jgi:flagellar basal-body rod modification protein FlgD
MNVSATSSNTTIPKLSREETGFNGLSSENFLEMMIVQLKNQDPLEPTGNEELLNQISQMRSLQSSIELSDVLKSVSSQQQLTSAASLIGKTVSGTVAGSNGTSQTVQGVVERAFVRGGEAYVGLGSREITVQNISSVE